MRKTLVNLLIVVTTLLFAVAFAACSSEKTDSQPLDPDTLTLEQILERTRLAVGEIVSYKSRGTTMWRSSTSGFEEPILEFSEVGSNGSYLFGSEHPDPYDNDVHRSEWRSVGTQVFSFHSADGWKESVEPRSEPSVISASDHFLTMLDENDIELRSTNERTEDGVKVYRLEFSEQFEQPLRRGGYEIKVIKTTLLINKESFRIVATLRDGRGELYPVSAASEIDTETHSRWTESVSTTEYYDFNEPVVIEVPAEYVPWSDDLVLSSALAP